MAEAFLHLRVQGLVQGVGFRPHIYRLATGLAITGWVANSRDGVEVELHGPRERLEHFVHDLLRQPPRSSRIDQLEQQWLPPQPPPPAFRIADSLSSGRSSALVSPDLAICPECLAELSDPSNRRFGYPFTSCTHCGPRYTLLEQLPFERAHTSLRAFPPCPACAKEYADPADRRFHAQTISCPSCGPNLRWNGVSLPVPEVLDQAATLLAQGQVVALQGTGGFQLLADPHQSTAIASLRRRKNRPDKPLALMASASWLQEHCRLGAEEARIWQSPAAPIVLVRPNRDLALASSVASSSPWLGVMRPVSGLHYLLVERCGGVLVATSANRSGEPIAADPQREAERLEELSDGVLSHDLPIVNRIDDSVIRWAAGAPLVLRLGRGLAPLALPLQGGCADLAVGAQSKGAIALRLNEGLVLSPDLGETRSWAGAEHLQRTARQWLERHQQMPKTIACDSHPGYSSSQFAEQWAEREGVPLQRVQHHRAHLLALLAEHDRRGQRAVGVAWDGAGWGEDGTLWGGEALEVFPGGVRRLIRLRPFPLPGGERAAREPRRVALALLLEAYGPRWRQRLQCLPELPWWGAFEPEELLLLERSLLRGVNAPQTSSVGRLFDGVAALLGLPQTCSFEAQAAMALEGLAQAAIDSAAGAIPPLDRYRIPLQNEWDWAPLIEQLLLDMEAGVPCSEMALGFHQALARAVAALAQQRQLPFVLLAGGCFQNRVLLELCVSALKTCGTEALWSQRLPCNDAALPIGQLCAD